MYCGIRKINTNQNLPKERNGNERFYFVLGCKNRMSLFLINKSILVSGKRSKQCNFPNFGFLNLFTTHERQH